MYTNDARIVMTLDAGGTNFVFSAIQGGLEIVDPVVLPACADCLENAQTGMMDGTRFGRLQKKVYDLDDEISFFDFARGEAVEVSVPGTNRKVGYDPCKRTGVILSRQGANRSIAMGASVFALNHLSELI